MKKTTKIHQGPAPRRCRRPAAEPSPSARNWGSGAAKTETAPKMSWISWDFNGFHGILMGIEWVLNRLEWDFNGDECGFNEASNYSRVVLFMGIGFDKTIVVFYPK
jgi:hypothetical protein